MNKLILVFCLVLSFKGYAQMKIKDDSLLSSSEKVTFYKKLIEQELESNDANYWFLYYCRANTINPEPQYVKWMLKYPENGILPMSLGDFYLNENSAKSNYYYKKAVKTNPKLVDAWLSLSAGAEINNDTTSRNQYLKDALEFNPDDAELNYRYAITYINIDFDKFSTLLYGVADKYTDNEYGAKSLSLLSYCSTDVYKKIEYYELLRKKFSPQKFRTSSNGMIAYFNFLCNDDFNKALVLVKEMSLLKIQYENWDYLLMEMEKIHHAKKMMLQASWSEAMELLNALKFPIFVEQPSSLIIKLKGEIIAQMYGPACAYDSLVKFYKYAPTKSNYNQIFKYGYLNKMDSSDIKRDVLKKLKEYADKATFFKLQKSNLSDSISLTNYIGENLLLTYYYPSCGPCRSELSIFEQVLTKTKNAKLNYVGININEKENAIVSSFIANHKYSFISLNESKYRYKGNLDNNGAAPANFIIDSGGNIIFKDFYINENNKEDLEIMINLLM